MYFHYLVTFTGYIRCFSATTSHDLVTLTFDILTLRVSDVQCFSAFEMTYIVSSGALNSTHSLMYIASHVRPTYQFLLYYDYRLLS